MKKIKGKVKTLDLTKNCEKYMIEVDASNLRLSDLLKGDLTIDIDPPINLTKNNLTTEIWFKNLPLNHDPN